MSKSISAVSTATVSPGRIQPGALSQLVVFLQGGGVSPPHTDPTLSHRQAKLDAGIFSLAQANRHLKKARFNASRHITDADTSNRVRLASDHLERAMEAMGEALTGRKLPGRWSEPCPKKPSQQMAVSSLAGLMALESVEV
ncbi:MAG: hypothetical protein HQL72_04270 [Magnetococcales bacterium]|nr:hypothetical protein [Magnetococcales bacterium]